MIGRLLKRFASPRTTVWLIGLVVAMLLAGQLIPQKQILQRDLYLAWKKESPNLVGILEALGVTDFYASPVVLVVWALFFGNLLAVMIAQVPARLRRMDVRHATVPASVAALPKSARLAQDERDAAARAWDYFAVRRYRLVGSTDRFLAVSHWYSPLATIVFHLSFLLLLGGGTVSVLTRFEGKVDLAEGEEFAGDLQQYVGRPRQEWLATAPSGRFVVRKVEPQVVGDTPTGVRVTVRDERGRDYDGEINHPIRIDGTSFVIQNVGVAPLLIMRDAAGQEVDGAFVRMNVLQNRTDGISINGAQLRVSFFPDHVVEAGKDSTRSQEIRNPRFRFEDLTLGKAQTVGLGEPAHFGDWSVTPTEMRFWVRMLARRESGIAVLWLGFALGSLALTYRLVFYRREFVVYSEEGTLLLAGRSEFYRALFDEEFERVHRGLSDHLRETRPPAPEA